MSKFLDFVIRDWYIAWPLLAMSMTGICLVLWRLFLNINANSHLDELLPAVQQKLESGGVDAALRYCRTRTDAIGRKLFVAGLDTAKQGLAAMRRAMANAVELEVIPDLNFLLPTILAIAKVATMVGLLGTVISMINVFQKIQDARGSQDVTGHSGEIGLALFATALGLVTAIPLVFSHVLFKAWVARFELRMKSAAQKLLVLVQNTKQGSAKSQAPETAQVRK